MSVHKCIWWSSNLSKCNARKKERNENTISIIFHYILICATKCICNMILHLVFPGLHNVFLSLTPFFSFVHCALHRIIFYMPSVNFLECFCSRYCKFVFVFLLKKKKNTKIYFDFFTSNCISMWFKYKRIHVCMCESVWRTQGKLIATHNQQLSAGRNAYQSAIDLLIYCALLSDGENIRLTENAHTPSLDLPMKQIYGTQICRWTKENFQTTITS